MIGKTKEREKELSYIRHNSLCLPLLAEMQIAQEQQGTVIGLYCYRIWSVFSFSIDDISNGCQCTGLR